MLIYFLAGHPVDQFTIGPQWLSFSTLSDFMGHLLFMDNSRLIVSFPLIFYEIRTK